MSKYLSYLIAQARRESENEDFGANNGIQDVEFIQYFNDAQHRLQSLIVAQRPQVFLEEKLIPSVANQEAYSLPADCFLGNMVSNVEYSPGNDVDYYNVSLGSLKNRTPGITGNPVYYIRKSEKLLLAPYPQVSGDNIRVNYVRRIAELDLRRGSVASVTLGTDTITALTLNTVDLDSTSLAEHEFFCVVDKSGAFKMKNIPFDSINAGTGVVTLTAGFTFESGETIEADDYIVGGKETTTHSELPRHCERYLIKYVATKILIRDSSIDATEASAELGMIEQDIIASYAEITDDVQTIPVIAEDWF